MYRYLEPLIRSSGFRRGGAHRDQGVGCGRSTGPEDMVRHHQPRATRCIDHRGAAQLVPFARRAGSRASSPRPATLPSARDAVPDDGESLRAAAVQPRGGWGDYAFPVGDRTGPDHTHDVHARRQLERVEGRLVDLQRQAARSEIIHLMTCRSPTEPSGPAPASDSSRCCRGAPARWSPASAAHLALRDEDSSILRSCSRHPPGSDLATGRPHRRR